MRIPTLLTISFLLSGVAQARIGETKEEAEKRYGKPERSAATNDRSELVFYGATNGIKVTGSFTYGTMDSITYERTVDDFAFNQAEIQKFWEINSGTPTWEKSHESEKGTTYETDKIVMAVFKRAHLVHVSLKASPQGVPENKIPGKF